MARLSVIIPVLNDSDLLEKCFAALAAQTRAIHEVIVVDNGSTDDSAAVAARLGARVISEPTPGIPAAASTGFDAATGDVLSRIDTDTIVPADWCSRVLAVFESDAATHALSGPGEFYGAPRPITALGRIFYMSAYFASVAPLVGQKPVFGSNYAIRAEVWQAIRDEVHLQRNVHDDMDVSFQLDGRYRITHDPSLSVLISARPITSPSNLAKHFWLAWVTIWVNWRERGPVERWKARRAT